MNLHKLTCNLEQSQKLISLGITGLSFLYFYEKNLGGWFVSEHTEDFKNYESRWPAWTKAELDAMIGPRFQKPDLWTDERLTKAQDPNTYPIFTSTTAYVFSNGASASAAGLIMLLEQDFLTAAEANDRYKSIFLK